MKSHSNWTPTEEELDIDVPGIIYAKKYVGYDPKSSIGMYSMHNLDASGKDLPQIGYRLTLGCDHLYPEMYQEGLIPVESIELAFTNSEADEMNQINIESGAIHERFVQRKSLEGDEELGKALFKRKSQLLKQVKERAKQVIKQSSDLREELNKLVADPNERFWEKKENTNN